MKRRLPIGIAVVLAAASTAAIPTLEASAADACGSGTWHAETYAQNGGYVSRRGGTTVYSGSSFRAAVQAAIGSLDSGRSSKQRVVVRQGGTIGAGERISLPSNTAIDVCGTINVSGSGSGDYAPIYSRGTSNVEVRHLTVTGTPVYGIFFRNVSNVHFGKITMNLSRGLGVRIDNRGDTSQWARNYTIESVYVSGASSHAVETYGVDGISIGTVTARNVGESGLLLNQTINATVGTVDAENAGSGTGYAAFRIANRAGRIGSSYGTNIKVGTVKARGGGRGIFCVSESGGATIDRIDIANTGNNAILLENCYNFSLASSGGSVYGGGDIRMASRSEFSATRQITLQNLTVTNNRIVENPCVSNLTIRNITLKNASIVRC